MAPRLPTLLLALLAACGGGARAVTVYHQQPIVTTTVEPGATYTGLPAYDPRVLDPPPLPNPLPANQFFIQLAQDAQNVQGLSIPLSGAFFGFSIEMSVVTQVGDSYIHPTFLNLMSLIAERAGRVHVRIGGNTQETARLVESLADGKAIEKEKVNTNNPTDTPALLYTPEILYLLSNISSLVNVKWYLGVPLNDTTNLALDIVTYGERILGDNLIGLQVGNEPDLYQRHGHRPEGYGPFDFFGEFGQVVEALKGLGATVNNKLLGPSLAHADWKSEDVWNTGFIPAYHEYLTALTVERYPDDNCAALYEGFGDPIDPQAEFPKYLDHSAPINLLKEYLNSTVIAQQYQKPFIMFETNTASCGGFPGISTSFGAALWALDYGLQMGYSNFSHALLHVGGQNVYYNVTVPTNQSSFHEWTVGPIFYSVLAVAETLGGSNHSQIVDLWPNSGSLFTPGYGIYEDGKLARLALFNYMTDPSGANDYTATIAVGGGETGQPNGTPAQIKVKYLVAPSVGDKWNVTWGGQTLGGQFEADGRLKGELKLETIPCDQAANTCQIKVPAPGYALVFLTDSAAAEAEAGAAGAATFPTTAVTKAKNTATIDEAVLATSNGNKGMQDRYGSTSAGSNAAPRAAGALPGAAVLLAVVAGAAVVRRAAARQI
ncbi:glycoside hydrolase family 79 protein [Trametes elegans]|nr:glycoside hydrolase family 79 protein [Trametes elegans]